MLSRERLPCRAAGVEDVEYPNGRENAAVLKVCIPPSFMFTNELHVLQLARSMFTKLVISFIFPPESKWKSGVGATI